MLHADRYNVHATRYMLTGTMYMLHADRYNVHCACYMLCADRYMLLEKKILALREELEEREAAMQVP